MPFSISGLLSSLDRYRPESFSPRVDIGRGICIKKNIELKRTKLTSHTDTKLIWISLMMITFLLWKKSYIDLFIERVDIVLSDFCPDICPWVDIAVAPPVFTYGHN